MESEDFVPSREFLKSSLGIVDGLEPLLSAAEATLQGIFVGGKVWVKLNYTWGVSQTVHNWTDHKPVPFAEVLLPGLPSTEFSERSFSAIVNEQKLCEVQACESRARVRKWARSGEVSLPTVEGSLGALSRLKKS